MKLKNLNVEAQIAIIRPVFKAVETIKNLPVDAQGTVIVIIKDAEEEASLKSLANLDVEAQIAIIRPVFKTAESMKNLPVDAQGSNTSDKQLNSVRRLIDVRAKASESSIKKSDNSRLTSDFERF